MSEELQKQEETPAESGTERVFTQEEVNTLVGQAKLKERGKYKDFDSYKAAFEELQAIKEQGKSELQKAIERAEAAERERDALASEKEIRSILREVAASTNVPIDLLHGATREEIEASASVAARYFKKDAAGVVGSDGFAPAKGSALTSKEKFAQWADEVF